MNKLSIDEIKKKLLLLVKSETKPAVGCTEPVAVALAAATANKYLKGSFEMLDIKVSKNIYKNGKSVTIPNTHECGINIAAALGVLCGDSEAGLLVFKDVTEEYVIKAKKLIMDEKVKVTPIYEGDTVFVEINLRNHEDEVIVVLRGSHTNIESVKVNGEFIIEKKNQDMDNSVDSEFIKDLTINQIREASETIDINDLTFILDGVKMNKEAAMEGLRRDSGLKWGASLLKLQKEGKISKDASTTARILTAAGSDLRMSGGGCPIMTSGGSGNQGLGVILPIAVVAEDSNIAEEKLIRAVFLAHSINIFVKKYTGKLSAMCGCAIAAGIAAAVGITWMLDGTEEQLEGAVQNMLANLTGMLCDGAKESCAMKLSTSSAESVLSAYLALNDTVVPIKTGIIGDTVEKTIRNLETLCKDAFVKVDDAMIDITCK